METLRKVVATLNGAARRVEGVTNFVCVFCLTLQTITICILVVGRYFFKMAPPGTEELSLLCMVWMALLSMTLDIRDDSHLKMELLDMFLPEHKLAYFKVVAGVLTLIFSVEMVLYGVPLWQLRWGAKMSSLPLSSAWTYAVIPLTGAIATFLSIVFLLNTILAILEHRLGNDAPKPGKEDRP